MCKLMIVALALSGAGVANAQTVAQRDPTEPKAGVPPVHYQSAFADYQTYNEPQVANWRDVNEAVRSAAGHAAKPAPVANGAPTPGAAPSKIVVPKPPAGGHAGH